jgi:hypothetical protein
VQRYYDRRAPEYDDWYLGLGLFAGRERAGWDEELHTLERTIAGGNAASIDQSAQPQCSGVVVL